MRKLILLYLIFTISIFSEVVRVYRLEVLGSDIIIDLNANRTLTIYKVDKDRNGQKILACQEKPSPPLVNKNIKLYLNCEQKAKLLVEVDNFALQINNLELSNDSVKIVKKDQLSSLTLKEPKLLNENTYPDSLKTLFSNNKDYSYIVTHEACGNKPKETKPSGKNSIDLELKNNCLNEIVVKVNHTIFGELMELKKTEDLRISNLYSILPPFYLFKRDYNLYGSISLISIITTGLNWYDKDQKYKSSKSEANDFFNFSKLNNTSEASTARNAQNLFLATYFLNLLGIVFLNNSSNYSLAFGLKQIQNITSQTNHNDLQEKDYFLYFRINY